jgi:hypothetical protein
MKARELLRYEIWSKETSRKILRPVGKCLKWVVIVSGSLAVLLVIIYVIESHWLTHGERGAGRTALAQVEELEKLLDCNCGRFAEMDKEAKTAIDFAKQKAWTLRDRRTALYLSFYLLEVEQYQTDDLREAQLKSFVLQRHLQWHSRPGSEQEDHRLRLEIFNEFRLELHKQLE